MRRRASELERYRIAIEATSHAIVISDLERRVIYANPAAHLLFGAEPGTLAQRPWTISCPRSRAARSPGATRAPPPASRSATRRWCSAPAGRARIVSVSNAPLREGDAVTGSVASLLDITDERRAHDAMAESEARYERLVETASDAIFSVDREGRFTSVNRSIEFAIGRRKEHLLGTPFRDTLYPETLEVAEQLFGEMLEGKRGRAELAYSMPGGERRIGSITTAPIIEQGEVTGAVGIMRDITEERRLAEELLQREKLAAIGQLVSGVAHELNNPLTGIMAFAQLLHSTASMSADQRDALETIHREAKRAAKIVSNLLLFARQRDPERRNTDINKVMLDTLELRRYVLRTQQVEIVTDLDPALPPTWADSVPAAAGGAEPHHQRRAGAPVAPRGRSGSRSRRAAAMTGIEMSVSRLRPGHPRGEPRPRLQPLLHDQGGRRGDGARPLDLRRHRPAARRRDPRRVAPGRGATFTVVLPRVAAPPPARRARDRAARAHRRGAQLPPRGRRAVDPHRALHLPPAERARGARGRERAGGARPARAPALRWYLPGCADARCLGDRSLR